ncbi:MAG: DUF58 domain-containing protein [Chromatiaceae bacterium]|nr:DUF58 domain-containing protein [Chromatiaceae bacterium]
MSESVRVSVNDGTRIDLKALIALRLEAGRLQLAPRGKVLATRSGGHLSRFRGRGMEFDESRVYQPGDDPRNMDWRVTARSAQPHVKLFREERERPVWLLVDNGPGMRFGTRVAFKSVVAAQAAALLAWAAADKGDRVGGLVFDEHRHVEHRPAARTRGLLPFLNTLADFSSATASNWQHRDAKVPPLPGLVSLSGAAGHLVHLVRPGSLVFLISDFAGLDERDAAWLARLAAGSEVVFVHIYDALEAVAPPSGRYPVIDGERRAVLDTGNVALRSAWSQRFADHVGLLQDSCRRYQTHLVSLRTDQPVGETLSEGLRPRIARAGGIR